MKRFLSLSVAAIIFLLLVPVISSCGSESAGSPGMSSAAGGSTSAEVTSCAHEWGEPVTDREATCSREGSRSVHCTKCGEVKPGSTEVIEKLPHTPGGEYTVDVEPTCKAPGSRSVHCTVCRAVIDSTVEEIPADPDGHVVYDWNVTRHPTMNSTGSRTGKCEVCDSDITEEMRQTEPLVYVSNWDAAKRDSMEYTYYYGGMKEFCIKYKIGEIQGADHFYPTEKDPEGNDLLVEFSFLWNESQKKLHDPVLTVMFVEDYNLFNIDLKSGIITARERTGDVYVDPSPADIARDASIKQVRIDDYGWHRFAVRLHMETEASGGNVNYKYIATAYLDGTEIFIIDKSSWVTAEGSYNHTLVDGRLYTAELDAGGRLIYDDVALLNTTRITVEEFYADGDPGYLVLGDVFFTCGKEFILPAEKLYLPEQAGDLTVADNVSLPAPAYFRYIQTN